MSDKNSPSAKVFWSVTALVFVVLTFVLINFARLRLALRLSEMIGRQSPTASTVYLAATGLFWGAAGLITIWWLLRRRSHSLLSLKLIAAGYSLNYWIEQIWLTHSPLRSNNWAFSAGLNGLILLTVFSFLSLSFVRKIFGDHNGRKSESN